MTRDTADELAAFALGLPGAWPDNPWEDGTVAKVGTPPPAGHEGPGKGYGKIFCFLGEETISVKGGRSREEADDWIDRYPDDVTVMPYIGKHGWNALRLDGAIDVDDLMDAIETSYELVVATLPKRQRPAQEA